MLRDYKMNDSLFSEYTMISTTSSLPLPSSNSTFHGIVSDEVQQIVTIINFAIVSAIQFVFGSITNTVNIIVFAKIGFKDPVNISLFVLSVSDFGCCFSLVLFAICFNPFIRQLDLPFDPNDFFYQSGWIHMIFSRITSLITAFITFERCLCVAFPLRVKEVITPKRVIVFLTCTVIVVVASFSPHFYTSRYVWKFIPARNKSIIVIHFIENRKEIEGELVRFHSIFLPFTAFFVVLVSTIVLVVNLKEKSKWRENVTVKSSSANNSQSSRDAKVSRMVVIIATLFIICFIPIMISFAIKIASPEYAFKGRYGNMLLIMFSFHFVLESLNSSLNIFIYHRMSSNYRAVFQQLFGIKQSGTN